MKRGFDFAILPVGMAIFGLMPADASLYGTFYTMPMNDTVAQSSFAVRELPYDYEALAPSISGETMHYHHDKHYAGYVAKLNELLLDSPLGGQPLEDIILAADGPLFNQAAQVWNHELFFDQLSPQPGREPSAELAAAIVRDFGSIDGLREQMSRAAAALFGSGWVWLAADREGRLSILAEPNAGNPILRGLTPLLALDLWEHAYYIDYRNRRADAVAALWRVVDWNEVSRRYARR